MCTSNRLFQLDCRTVCEDLNASNAVLGGGAENAGRFHSRIDDDGATQSLIFHPQNGLAACPVDQRFVGRYPASHNIPKTRQDALEIVDGNYTASRDQKRLCDLIYFGQHGTGNGGQSEGGLLAQQNGFVVPMLRGTTGKVPYRQQAEEEGQVKHRLFSLLLDANGGTVGEKLCCSFGDRGGGEADIDDGVCSQLEGLFDHP